MSIHDRKQREFERRGQEIKAAALRLFKGPDWESVTVDQIAAASDIGKGTVYKHFPSKDAIYADLANDFQLALLAKLNTIDPDLPVLARLRESTRLVLATHLASREQHRVYIYCSREEFRARLATPIALSMQRVDQRVGEYSQQLLIQGMEQGIFPRQPISQLLFGAQSAVWGAIQLIWSGYLGPINQEQYLDALMRFIIAGLTADLAAPNARTSPPPK